MLRRSWGGLNSRFWFSAIGPDCGEYDRCDDGADNYRPENRPPDSCSVPRNAEVGTVLPIALVHIHSDSVYVAASDVPLTFYAT